MTGALLKELSAVFFNSARKPGVCARSGFTPPSPEGHHSTERYSETAGGVRIKGHFFTAAVEVLLACDEGVGQLEEW